MLGDKRRGQNTEKVSRTMRRRTEQDKDEQLPICIHGDENRYKGSHSDSLKNLPHETVRILVFDTATGAVQHQHARY